MLRFGSIGIMFVAALVGCAGTEGAEGATGTTGVTGALGAQGASAVARIVTEAPGTHCPEGGQALDVGIDTNENGTLDDAEITSTAYVCNGATGAMGDTGATGDAGATGSKGDKGDTGDAGDKGDKGDTGAAVPEVKLGIFTASQIVKGAIVTCTGTSASASVVQCSGLEVDGLDARLAPAEANALCNAITGKGYDTASGAGSTTAPFMTYGATGWVVGTGGAVAPLQNLTCNR